MLDDYSLIFSGFLIALVIVPFVSACTRNDLQVGGTALKTAVVNGLVVVGLLLQYIHIIYIGTYAPHHSMWSDDNT